jgi:DNA-binding transcriptional ArsR family regulator
VSRVIDGGMERIYMATATKVKTAGTGNGATTNGNGNGNGNGKAAQATGKAAPSAKDFQRQAVLLKQLSDATRLQVCCTLYHGEMHVGAISAMMGQSQPAVSHHLALLRHGGIIEPRRDGKCNFYNLTEKGRALVEPVVKAMGI